MGYWAKDGSYIRDERDNQQELTEREKWEASERSMAGMRENEERKKRELEQEQEARAQAAEAEREAIKKRIEKEQRLIQEAEDRRYQNNPMLGLNNPRNLDERRARANYWRINSKWGTLINRINGKSKKFEDLWEKYSHTNSQEEKLKIVEEMERMFPTTTSKLQAAERQEGRGR